MTCVYGNPSTGIRQAKINMAGFNRTI